MLGDRIRGLRSRASTKRQDGLNVAEYEPYATAIVEILQKYPGITANMDLSKRSPLVMDLASNAAKACLETQVSLLAAEHSALYDVLPSGDVDAWTLLDIIRGHLDKLCELEAVVMKKLNAINKESE